MTRRLRVPDDLARLIRSLHPDLKRRVRAALSDIVDDRGTGKPLRDGKPETGNGRMGRH